MMDKLNDMIEVVAFCKANELPASIVGRWVWVEFDSRPADHVRAKLRAAGFRWNSRRLAWQHDCGHPSVRSGTDPRFRYGAVRIDATDRAYEDKCAAVCGR